MKVSDNVFKGYLKIFIIIIVLEINEKCHTSGIYVIRLLIELN